MVDSQYEFPDCMHALSAALHMLRVDPHDVTISLPADEWWKLQCALESKFRGLMRFDGCWAVPNQFQYMGFRFKPEFPPQQSEQDVR